jgi:hypothetical protein
MYDSSLIERIESVDGYVPSYEELGYSLSPYYGSSLTIRFTYTLESGSVVSRSYNIPYEWTSSLKELMYNKGVLKAYAPNVALREQYKFLNTVSLQDAFTPVTSSFNVKNFDIEQFSQAYEKDFENLSSRSVYDLQPETLGYVKIKTCKSEKNENTCIESSILINSLYTNTLAYLDSINASFPEMSNFVSLKPIILIPSEKSTDDYKYYTALGLN